MALEPATALRVVGEYCLGCEVPDVRQPVLGAI